MCSADYVLDGGKDNSEMKISLHSLYAVSTPPQVNKTQCPSLRFRIYSMLKLLPYLQLIERVEMKELL